MNRVFFITIVAVIIAFCSCEVVYDVPIDEFEEIVIKKGDHGSRPYFYSYEHRDSFRMQFVFTSSSPYDLGDVDQKDWNKLIGWSFHNPNRHKNSAMVAWRWGLECQCNELTAYYHRDGERAIAINPNPLPGHDYQVLTTIGEVGSVKARFYKHPDGMVDVWINDVKHSLQFSRSVIDNKVLIINTWFGGNEFSPHDMYFLRKQF